MRRLILCLVGLLPFWVLVCAQAQFSSFPPGTFNSRAALDTAGGCAATLVLDGSGHGNTSTTTVAATITTTHTNDVIVATVSDPGGSPTIADTSLLTWTARTGSPYSGGGHTQYVWSAVSAGILTADVVTVTAAATFHTLDVFGVSGADTSTIFDASVVQASPDPVLISTTFANTFIYGVANAGTGSPTAGTGFTLISGADFQGVEYKIVSAAQTNLSVGWTTGNGTAHLMLADAIKRSC